MLLEIELRELDPPAGTARIEGQEGQTFVGWLGLMRAVSELTTVPAKP